MNCRLTVRRRKRKLFVFAIAAILMTTLAWYVNNYFSLEQMASQEIRLRDYIALNRWRAFFIGFGIYQLLALVPGTSRAGITITSGLFLGLTRKAAARFSFLLAIPVIVASGALQTFRMLTEVSPIGWLDLLLAVVLSAFSAALCIHFFLRLIEKTGMLPYVIYRVMLGILIFWLIA